MPKTNPLIRFIITIKYKNERDLIQPAAINTGTCAMVNPVLENKIEIPMKYIFIDLNIRIKNSKTLFITPNNAIICSLMITNGVLRILSDL